MKKYFTILLLFTVMISCKENRVHSNLYPIDSIKTAFDAAKALDSAHDDFLTFKNEKKFLTKRSSEDEPEYYKEWIHYVYTIASKDAYKNLCDSFNYYSEYDLTQLYHYYEPGAENDIFNFCHSNIKEIQKYKGKKITKKVKTEKNITTTVTIKKVHIGKWEIENTLESSSGFTLSVYKQGNEYFSLENNTEYKLVKKGNKYYKDDSPSGEYYLINGKKLRLCDSYGDFTESSYYKVTFIE